MCNGTSYTVGKISPRAGLEPRTARSVGQRFTHWGWLGGSMVLGKLPVPGRPTIWITVGQGSTTLAVRARGGCLDIFTRIYPFSPPSPSL